MKGKRYKQMGQLPGLEGLPRRLLGVIHRAVYRQPEACWHCGSRRIVTDRLDPRRFACFDCARDCYLVRPPAELEATG